MLNIPKMMLKELDKFIQNKDIFNQYISNGLTFNFDLCTFELIITYSCKEYVVNLVNKNEKLYWHLVPYNNSFYETSVDNGLDSIIFAIKENEELYSKKGN